MFELDITPDALADMQVFWKYDRQRIVEEIEEQLSFQPDAATVGVGSSAKVTSSFIFTYSGHE